RTARDKVMAGFRKRTPLGLFEDRFAPGGIAHGAGSGVPGPLGVARSSHLRSSRARDAAGTLAEALGGAAGVSFAVGAETYRLRRAEEKGARAEEEPVGAEESVEIVKRAASAMGGSAMGRLLEHAAAHVGAERAPGGPLVLFRVQAQAP